ncbi:MAG: hypothetical protein C0469_16515 [Cyanobacteria bacterium DS2.3.42]|nr:hypothetical protein [Cyanobacteria bacterium DS2.3.42]
MPPFENITNNGELETEADVQEVSEILTGDSITAQTAIEKPNTFSLSHKNPELQSVMQQAEIINVSHNELSPNAFDASFLQAQEALVSHFESKLSKLPADVRASFLESLDLQSNYKPEFPLYAQVLKSSYA